MKHYPRLAGRARVSVFHLLLHGLKQPLVVSGRCNGLGPNVLHRAEGFRPQVQIVETSLEQHVSIAGHAGIYIEKAKKKNRENTSVRQGFNYVPVYRSEGGAPLASCNLAFS